MHHILRGAHGVHQKYYVVLMPNSNSHYVPSPMTMHRVCLGKHHLWTWDLHLAGGGCHMEVLCCGVVCADFN